MKKTVIVLQVVLICALVAHIVHSRADMLDWITLAVLGVSAVFNAWEDRHDAE